MAQLFGWPKFDTKRGYLELLAFDSEHGCLSLCEVTVRSSCGSTLELECDCLEVSNRSHRRLRWSLCSAIGWTCATIVGEAFGLDLR